MANPRKQSKQATETLQEIDSAFDRAAQWAIENQAVVLSVLGVVLVVAGLVGLLQWQGARSARAASTAVADIQAAYYAAMGAEPGTGQIVEPANPETGRRVRTETIDKLLKAADEHDGTAAAISALLSAAELQFETEDAEAGLATLRRAADAAPGGSALRGLALSKLGRALEVRGEWAEAAAAHEKAADIEDLPTRALALAS